MKKSAERFSSKVISNYLKKKNKTWKEMCAEWAKLSG